mmetsp:Transcript_35789/g.84832  ORF Transcript_35789/g.84832 Transcript_35789/m.84832 type:complete len:204 (-) Transcript_35789:1988-2599(-)
MKRSTGSSPSPWFRIWQPRCSAMPKSARPSPSSSASVAVVSTICPPWPVSEMEAALRRNSLPYDTRRVTSCLTTSPGLPVKIPILTRMPLNASELLALGSGLDDSMRSRVASSPLTFFSMSTIASAGSTEPRRVDLSLGGLPFRLGRFLPCHGGRSKLPPAPLPMGGGQLRPWSASCTMQHHSTASSGSWNAIVKESPSVQTS